MLPDTVQNAARSKEVSGAAGPHQPKSKGSQNTLTESPLPFQTPESPLG